MRIIATYLPQYHDCPFNSNWWGKGFTEWNNVKRAKPLFNNHKQPREPSGGYYALDSVEEIQRQATQSKKYGIDGFSIYHYWYEGKRPLAKPLDLILKNTDIDINFSLCWANHSWTRSWKNRLGALDVLIEQTYETTTERMGRHCEFLCTVFSDKRYICVGDKPLFQIYQPENIPNLSFFIDELRRMAYRKIGKDVHISGMLTSWKRNWDYIGELDSITLFQPSLALFSPHNIFDPSTPVLNKNGLLAVVRDAPQWMKKIMYAIRDIFPESFSIYNYVETWSKLIDQYEHCVNNSKKHVFPMAFVDFDNTPRYGQRAKIFGNYSTEIFQKYLTILMKSAMNKDPDNILFINAWNEWGEGMYLEPDILYGNSRLDTVWMAKKSIL